MLAKIFINYRREDSAASSGRLYDRLEGEFGSERLFIDVDNIAAGADFVKVLNDQVSQCAVMLCVIGPNWLHIKENTKGTPRLDNPNDFVRVEIEAAFSRDIRVIPVLVDNADMPRSEMLPEGLEPLSRRNAIRLTHERFRADSAGLIKSLKTTLQEVEVKRAADENRQKAAREKAALDARKKEDLNEQKRKEQARQAAIAGLSPEDVAKAEELANWDFIKKSRKEQAYRDHIARFPDGVTKHMAISILEKIVWLRIGKPPKTTAIEAYLDEFPNGEKAEEARKKLEVLAMREQQDKEKAKRIEKEEVAWKAIKDSKDPDTFKTFTTDWPGGKYYNEAVKRCGELNAESTSSDKYAGKPSSAWRNAVFMAITVALVVLISQFIQSLF